MDTPSVYLTSQQVCRALEELDGAPLNLRTLAAWSASGLARPSVAWPRRRRAPRLYSRTDLSRVRLVAALRRHGLSMPRVRTALAWVDAQLPAALKVGTRAVLVVSPLRAAIYADPAAVAVDLREPGQLQLPLEAIATSYADAARFAKTAA